MAYYDSKCHTDVPPDAHYAAPGRRAAPAAISPNNATPAITVTGSGTTRNSKAQSEGNPAYGIQFVKPYAALR
jgi:hypothetical protein